MVSVTCYPPHVKVCELPLPARLEQKIKNNKTIGKINVDNAWPKLKDNILHAAEETKNKNHPYKTQP